MLTLSEAAPAGDGGHVPSADAAAGVEADGSDVGPVRGWRRQRDDRHVLVLPNK